MTFPRTDIFQVVAVIEKDVASTMINISLLETINIRQRHEAIKPIGVRITVEYKLLNVGRILSIKRERAFSFLLS